MALESLAVRRAKKQAKQEKRLTAKFVQLGKQEMARESSAFLKHLMGFTMEWTDSKPLDETAAQAEGVLIISNGNSILAHKESIAMWKDSTKQRWICHGKYLWEVNAHVVYQFNNEQVTDVIRYFRRGSITNPTGETELNEEMLNKVTASLLSNTWGPNPKEFSHVEYKLICVGV